MLVGVFDYFWELKGVILLEEYCWFCNVVVLLVWLMCCVFMMDDLFEVMVELV